MASYMNNATLEVWKSTQWRRRDATAAWDMATWRVDAGRLHGAATAVTATTGESARLAGKRSAWT
jgi:hypothetical protein